MGKNIEQKVYALCMEYKETGIIPKDPKFRDYLKEKYELGGLKSKIERFIHYYDLNERLKEGSERAEEKIEELTRLRKIDEGFLDQPMTI